jgi:hypothetical protein
LGFKALWGADLFLYLSGLAHLQRPIEFLVVFPLRCALNCGSMDREPSSSAIGLALLIAERAHLREG